MTAHSQTHIQEPDDHISMLPTNGNNRTNRNKSAYVDWITQPIAIEYQDWILKHCEPDRRTQVAESVICVVTREIMNLKFLEDAYQIKTIIWMLRQASVSLIDALRVITSEFQCPNPSYKSSPSPPSPPSNHDQPVPPPHHQSHLTCNLHQPVPPPHQQSHLTCNLHQPVPPPHHQSHLTRNLHQPVPPPHHQHVPPHHHQQIITHQKRIFDELHSLQCIATTEPRHPSGRLSGQSATLDLRILHSIRILQTFVSLIKSFKFNDRQWKQYDNLQSAWKRARHTEHHFYENYLSSAVPLVSKV